MRRGTTPTITVTVGADLTGKEIHLAFQSGELVVKSGNDLDVSVEDGITTITTALTQEDTLSFSTAQCRVQARAFNSDGSIALATDIGTLDVRDILEDGKLPAVQGIEE